MNFPRRVLRRVLAGLSIFPIAALEKPRLLPRPLSIPAGPGRAATQPPRAATRAKRPNRRAEFRHLASFLTRCHFEGTTAHFALPVAIGFVCHSPVRNPRLRGCTAQSSRQRKLALFGRAWFFASGLERCSGLRVAASSGSLAMVDLLPWRADDASRGMGPSPEPPDWLPFSTRPPFSVPGSTKLGSFGIGRSVALFRPAAAPHHSGLADWLRLPTRPAFPGGRIGKLASFATARSVALFRPAAAPHHSGLADWLRLPTRPAFSVQKSRKLGSFAIPACVHCPRCLPVPSARTGVSLARAADAAPAPSDKRSLLPS